MADQYRDWASEPYGSRVTDGLLGQMVMPVVQNGTRNGPVLFLPFALLDEKHAQKLHGQSLEQLAYRGGLSAHEAICHIDRIGLWDRQPLPNDHEEVARRIRSFNRHDL
jgi:hypothetical protein